jgi:hypothetical protein
LKNIKLLFLLILGFSIIRIIRMVIDKSDRKLIENEKPLNKSETMLDIMT